MNKLKILNILKTIFIIITLTLYTITALLILILKTPINSMKIIFYIGCTFLILSTVLYITQLIIEKKSLSKKEKPIKDKKQQIKEIKVDNIKIEETKIEENTKETITPIKKDKSSNKNIKTRKLQILYYIFISLSIINLLLGLILLNIPLLYLLIIPNIISLFILSIVFYIVAHNINNKIKSTNSNRE